MSCNDKFKVEAYERLSGSIRVPTESYDDFAPVGVNTYGLVFHWEGTSESGSKRKKPILLVAHQDVVPVDNTVYQWIHPPYSGYFDGTWIWGRGSADDKADLVSQLIANDSLIKAGFQPQRTIILAFGIDEEASGTEGAGKLALYLEETYGRNGFAVLLDEGGESGVAFRYAIISFISMLILNSNRAFLIFHPEGYGDNAPEDGTIFARPGISEKGYIDIKIEVLAPGGHSSVPPPHTAIGLLSLIIVELEKRAHKPEFIRSGAGLANVLCTVTYGDEKYNEELKPLAQRVKNHGDGKSMEEFKRNWSIRIPFSTCFSRPHRRWISYSEA